jgi:hypothetical protein
MPPGNVARSEARDPSGRDGDVQLPGTSRPDGSDTGTMAGYQLELRSPINVDKEVDYAGSSCDQEADYSRRMAS